MRCYVGRVVHNRITALTANQRENRPRRSRSTKASSSLANNRVISSAKRDTAVTWTAKRLTNNRGNDSTRMAYGTPTNWARNRKVRHWVCFIRTWHKQRLNPQLQSLARYADRISVWHTWPLIFERAVSANEHSSGTRINHLLDHSRKNGLFLPCLRSNRIKWWNYKL